MKKTMSSNNEYKSMHIVMYPWFALSHLTSFLRLANNLAQRGHKISFFLPTKTQLKLSPHNHHPHLITFIPVTVPPVEGLPAEAETTNDVPASAIPLLMASLDLTKDMLDSQLAHLKPDFVFFDFAMWAPELAKKHGAKSLYYATSNLVRFAYGGFESRSLGLDQEFKDGELMSPPPVFPTPAMALGSGEARALALGLRSQGGGVSFFKRLRIGFRECDAIGSKTCREIEGPYCEFFQKEQRKPVLLGGPLVPKLPTGKLDEKFDGWLKGFGKGSVVYCALGSECVLNLELFQELVLGLELIQDAKGNDVSLSEYKGKVLLIVNVASKCGMTNSNYDELNQLYEKYKDQGLEILAFPCNQFGDEEPGSNSEIVDFVCTRFKSAFPIFDKIEVNGENAAPLYKFLKLGKWGIFGDDIQWNFAKFLVNKSGQVVGRYYPTTSLLSLEYDIKKLLEIA